MNNMARGRGAGGSGPAFTAAVIIAILVLVGLFIWRVLPVPITSDQPAIQREAPKQS
jgi:hypothetical protein